MLIKSTNLQNARLMDFYQVMSITADFLHKEDLPALKLTEVSNEFFITFEVFDKAMKQAMKTGYTDQIIAADDARDAILTGFLGALRSMLYFPDKAISAAAAQLMTVVDKYGSGIQRLPQREETAVITNLLQDLRNTENAPHVQATSLTMWIDKLDEANKTFDSLYTHRTEKEAEFIIGLTRTERANMQAVFEKLCRSIEAYGFIEGEEKYKPLADKINVEVTNVQQATKARATMAKNTRFKPPTQP